MGAALNLIAGDFVAEGFVSAFAYAETDRALGALPVFYEKSLLLYSFPAQLGWRVFWLRSYRNFHLAGRLSSSTHQICPFLIF